MSLWILIACTTFIPSFIVTYIFRKFALKKSILDIPNERSSHDQPIPRAGGIVFVAVFYLLLILLWFWHDIQTYFGVAMLGGLPVAIIGYIDDLYSVKIQWRILVHFIAALWGVVWLGMALNPALILVVLVTVWFINLYNFMDGIDGLAASEAVFVSFVGGVALLLEGYYGMGALCIGLGAAVLGFLCWNWSPAKIFMGDIGSGFLGYAFAMFMWVTAIAHMLHVLFWWILLALFLSDATYTLINRMKQKKKWYLAHHEHVYQRLIASGFKHSQVTMGAIGINFFILLPLAFTYLYTYSTLINISLVFFLAIIIWLFWFYIYKKYPIVGCSN